jgi:hypothetical protein
MALATTGCSDDDLYQEPSTSLSDETVISSYETAKTVLMGAYASTEHYYYLTIGQVSQEVMGNDITITSGNYGYSTYNWLMYAYNYTQYASKVDGWWSNYSPYMWQRAYKAIGNCNQLIANQEALPTGCEDLLAQAYGIRGWNFLNLYHLFCAGYNNPTYGGDNGKGLFLRLTPASADNSLMVERSNLKESLAQIISDLTYAYEHVSASNNNYYMNPKAAALLLARTYMELNDYSNASKYAEIAASNTFDGSNLMSREEYQSGFMVANSEWLWGANFNSETTNIYASIPSFYHVCTAMDANSTFGTAAYGTQIPGDNVAERYEYVSSNGVDYKQGYSTVRVAASFVNTFARDENGIFADCRALFPCYLHTDDGYFTAKYNNQGGALGVADYPLARIAEAYLIEAEAKMQLGQAAEGLKVLNTLQAQRGGSISAEINLDEIYQERRRELYGEGFALGDLKRYQKGLTRVGDEHWCDAELKNLPANSPRMMFPIPDNELKYNPYYKENYNEGQNDYWKE